MFEKIAILIPAFNPMAALPNLVGELNDVGFRTILIVDDGSSDKRYIHQAERKFDIDVCVHPVNMGKGAALKTGYRYLIDKYPDELQTIITVDADGQHLTKDVLNVAEHAQKWADSLVLGARGFQKSVPLRSLLGNQLTRLVLARAARINLLDTQTGLRAVPQLLARQACELSSDRYEFELESILLADRLGIGIHEIPIATVYIEDNESSHFRPIIDSMKIYAVFARFLGVSLASFCIDIVIFAIHYSISSQIYTSTYVARGISAIFNFSANKLFVFKSRRKFEAIVEVFGYFALVTLVATASAFLVAQLALVTAMNVVILKIIVDTALFFVSFFSQKHILFRVRE